MRAALEAAIGWLLAQPSDPFGIDAKCVLADAGVVTAEQAAAIRADKVSLARESLLPDGASESKYGGRTGSVLWTADAIRHLSVGGVASDQPLIARAADWLAGRQLTDGSWLESEGNWPRRWYRASNGHLWITAACVQSLQQATYDTSELESRAVRFLTRGLEQFAALRGNGIPEAVQIQLGYDRFSLAVVIDALTARGVEIPSRAAIASYLSSDQSPTGEWEGSIDVTQATAHALVLLAPDLMEDRLAAADRYLVARSRAEGGWSHKPDDPRPDWTLTAYTVRYLARRDARQAASASSLSGRS